MQHFEVTTQLAYKLRAFEETLQHLGKVKAENILPPISGPLDSYRHKARFRVKFVKKKNKVLIGFNEKKSHFLTDMKMCAVVPTKIRFGECRYNVFIGSLYILLFVIIVLVKVYFLMCGIAVY